MEGLSDTGCGKMALVFVGVSCLAAHPDQLVTVEELQAILGHLAWIALLARPSFSCLHDVYTDARGTSADAFRPGRTSIAELRLFVMLMPLIEGDLTRTWADLLIASDASPAYGFGVSVAHAAPELLRAFARDVGKRRAFARLERDGSYEDDEPEKHRQGRPCRFPICKSSFLHCGVGTCRACCPRWRP